jgi:hypothetical protein
VGNRSCIWDPWGLLTGFVACNGFANFTRWRAIREDKQDHEVADEFIWKPRKRVFHEKVDYLYHRWQQEFGPPFDYSCPGYGDDIPWPCLSGYNTEAEFLLDYPGGLVRDVEQAAQTGITNIQSKMDTQLDSGKDVNVVFGNWGGGADGHGELVGFRGTLIGSSEEDFWTWFWVTVTTKYKIFEFESYPLALETQGDWPIWDPYDPYFAANGRKRAAILRRWETDPSYLYKQGWEPWNPGLCRVSRDLSKILDLIIGPPDAEENQPPVADAGEDRTVAADGDCLGQITLDGSGSTDPDGDELSYTWTWNDGADQATGPNPTIELPLGVHEISLVVSDGELDSEPDTVLIEVVDGTPPVIELEGSANMTLECAVDPWEGPGAVATDNCDDYVAVIIGGDTVDPEAPGAYTITYDAEDAAGNQASQVSRTVTVEDTLPPTIESVTASPASLWPPNHELIPVHFSVSAYDVCDAAPDIVLVAVTSDEPEDAPGGGDGHTTGDIRDAGIGTADYSILLRAERQGGGDGRVYTVTYSVTDETGNSASSGTAVTVGHDRRRQSGRTERRKESD